MHSKKTGRNKPTALEKEILLVGKKKATEKDQDKKNTIAGMLTTNKPFIAAN